MSKTIKQKDFATFQVVKRFPPNKRYSGPELSSGAKSHMLGELAGKMFQSRVFDHEGQPIIMQIDWNYGSGGGGGDTIVSVTANVRTILL